MDHLLPRALCEGDEVAVVAPAGGVRDEDALQRGLARLRGWGLVPVLLPHARGVLEWPDGSPLAATDAERLSDLQAAIDDPRYRAVFCARGGYGTSRLLGELDLAPLRRDPKPIVGYSDITVLLQAARMATGLIGFHGPMVATTASMDAGDAGWSLQQRLLTSHCEPVALPAAAGARGLCAGSAEGPLVGGNLSLVQCLIGTPWQLDTAGALLFLEDIGEAPYRIDRLLTQLHQTGALARAAGVILGDFHIDGTPLGSEQPAMTAVLEERLRGLSVPVACGFPFGHRPGAWTLPVGVRARLVVPAVGGPATLELLESAARA
ncbi:MAG: LD-carboxypeptidase [Planctomycetes bacterium]|nr:LD-carboxypeptidase [Planctomycetota bacterium]